MPKELTEEQKEKKRLYNKLLYERKKEQIIKESETGYNNIILDFNGNVHIDSSGIGAIFNSQKYLLEKQGSLKIKNLGHETLSILKIANLDKHLNII